MARLTILTGALRGKTFEMPDQRGKMIIIGRGRDGVDIQLPDPAVSRRHLELSYRDGQWMARDVGSANGTYLDELRIDAPTLLTSGCQIRCGATALLFETAASQTAAGSAPVELVFDPGETVVAVAMSPERNRAAAALHQRIYQAGQIALTVSHGVKNLLQAVQSAQELLGQALDSGQIDLAKKNYKLLTRNLQKTQKTILDMLKFSKPAAPRFQACMVNRLVETVVGLVWPQAQAKPAALSTELDAHLEQVQADPDLLQDALLNLLLNALDAVPPQTGAICVATRLLSPQSRWQLIVSDNGKGIADTAAIFEPFYTDKTGAGVGLGLAITRQIVAAHNGTIDAQSELGRGATFTLTFPLNPKRQ